ncbi:talin-2 [Caerostris extrusa]|uniref:Talin-2 n=1 Tax=Caerostris extrusa TaxID=172846 RepID=A0AAV4UM13_CAEEX|nr:talin-2 [Caerostris extrusa]
MKKKNSTVTAKILFSDQNVDSRDPVQLNLLYVQARDAIINGTHPVTLEQASQFAGMQCQIQFGDHVETKHKPGFLDLKRNFLPKDYAKMKGIEKRVFAEHKKFIGNTELEAKVKYVSLARSLKTYGVAFFLVKGKNERKKTSLFLDCLELLKIVSCKQAKDHFGIEGDEGSTMVEDNVSAAKATILQHNPAAKVSHGNSVSVVVPAVMRAAENGARQYNTGQTPSAQFGETKGQAHSAYAAVQPQHPKIQQTMSEPQRALLSTISAGRNAVENAQNDLSVRLAAMNAATAQVITLTSGPPEEVDHPAFGAAVNTIATNLTEMSKDVKVIAALMDDDLQGENLLDAARNLCSAFYDLLKAAEPETKEPRQNLLNAASRVGEASHAVLKILEKRMLWTKKYRIFCWVLLSVVAPTISNPTCQQQLIEAAKEVSRAVEGINKVCYEATKDNALLNDMGQASGQVEDALSDLVNHIKTASKQRAQATVHDGAVDTILDATDRLFSSTGDAGEMVRQAKILATATATLIQAIKGEASSQTDSDIQKRLLAAAKVLADATAKMVEAAKGCASNPHDSASQAALQKAAEDLRSATNAAANNALKRKLIRRLEQAAKHTAAMSTQNIAAAQGAKLYNQNPNSQHELLESCKEVADVIPKLVHGVKGTIADVDNPSAQLALISSCEAVLQPGNKMVSASKAALPTITDQSTSLQLSNASKQMSNALMELRTSMMKAQEACGSLELENALDLIRSLDDELLAFRKAAENMELRPLPGETMENSALQLGSHL